MDINIAYIAGLFDGEGSAQCKKKMETKIRRGKRRTYNCWRISMEMSMTDESVIRWVHDVLGVGTVIKNIKNKSPSSKPYWKDQWRWRCSHRDAYYVARLLFPFAHVKAPELSNIIAHYAVDPKANIVDLHNYKQMKEDKANGLDV